MRTRTTPPLIFLAALAVFPLFLRRRMRIFRRIVIRASPATIFPFVNDVRNWPLWLDWGGRARAAHYSYEGPPAGAGAMQKFESPRHEGALKILSSSADERVVFHIDLENGRRHAEGIVGLESRGRHTIVRLVLKWNGHANPWARYADLARMIEAGRRMSSGLRRLKDLAERAEAEDSH